MVTCDGVGLWNCSVGGTGVLAGDEDGNKMLATKYLCLTRTILCGEHDA